MLALAAATRAVLLVAYTASGAALFIYLFVKHIRRGLADCPPHASIFEQRGHLKQRMLPHLIGLLVALFLFAATARWLLHIWFE